MRNKQIFVTRNTQDMEELVDELNHASDAYYNEVEEMTNFEFDQKLEKLQQLEKEEGRVLPNSPTVNVGAPVNDKLPKFKHTHLALSLDKTKDVDELYNAFEKGVQLSGCPNPYVVIMWKEDGATIQAYYDDGKLDKLVTRGNGEIGSVITHNAANITGLPLTVPFKGEMIVRGEALMSYEEFNRINSEFDVESKYRNPRNLAAATLSMLDSNEASKRKIVMKAFNLVYISDETAGHDLSISDSFSDRLRLLDDYGFDTVERHECHIMELKDVVSAFTNQASSYIYPVDGIVVAMDNYGYTRKLEGTEHHPNILSGYAFKWQDETHETTLRDIEWSPSRTGLLNPVAVFDPVEIDGTIVSRASLHNVSEMYRILGPHPYEGERISVYKANKVIPVVEKGYYGEE